MPQFFINYKILHKKINFLKKVSNFIINNIVFDSEKMILD